MAASSREWPGVDPSKRGKTVVKQLMLLALIALVALATINVPVLVACYNRPPKRRLNENEK